jgi:hypothetical protein
MIPDNEKITFLKGIKIFTILLALVIGIIFVKDEIRTWKAEKKYNTETEAIEKSGYISGTRGTCQPVRKDTINKIGGAK